MSALDKITVILEEVESVNSRLDEKVTPKEKRDINNIINKNKGGSFNFNGIDTQVTTGHGNIIFSYPTEANADELTFALTDIADARGLEFKYTTRSKTNTFTIML